MAPINGMIVPIVTPLNTGGGVDTDALARLCEIQIEAGIDGLFVLGTTGEFYGLTLAQRRTVVGNVLENVNGRIPVVAGITGDSSASALEAFRACRHDGLAGYVSSTPYFMHYGQEELADCFRRLADAVEQPLILYNFPGRYGQRIEIDTIHALLTDRQICALKDTEGDFAYMRRLLKLKESFPSFGVFEGALPNLARSARLGIDGSVQALGNLLPRECAALWTMIENRQWDALTPAVDTLWSFHQAIETEAVFIAAMKGCMSLRGWCGPTPAHPTRPVSGQNRTALETLMTRYDAI
jgi:4-hydroxy-tetrahydrodipicolinate synthase